MKCTLYVLATFVLTVLVLGDMAGVTVRFRSPVVVTIPERCPPTPCEVPPAATKPRKADPKPPAEAPCEVPPAAPC